MRPHPPPVPQPLPATACSSRSVRPPSAALVQLVFLLATSPLLLLCSRCSLLPTVPSVFKCTFGGIASSLAEHEGGRRIAAAADARALFDLFRLPGAERLVVLLLVARAAAARQAVGRFDRGSPGWAAASVLGCPPSQAPCSSSPCTASLNDSRITSIHSAISIILKHAHSLLQHFFLKGRQPQLDFYSSVA